MKSIIVVISVFTTAASIRMPTSWDSHEQSGGAAAAAAGVVVVVDKPRTVVKGSETVPRPAYVHVVNRKPNNAWYTNPKKKLPAVFRPSPSWTDGDHASVAKAKHPPKSRIINVPPPSKGRPPSAKQHRTKSPPHDDHMKQPQVEEETAFLTVDEFRFEDSDGRPNHHPNHHQTIIKRLKPAESKLLEDKRPPKRTKHNHNPEKHHSNSDDFVPPANSNGWIPMVAPSYYPRNVKSESKPIEHNRNLHENEEHSQKQMKNTHSKGPQLRKNHPRLKRPNRNRFRLKKSQEELNEHHQSPSGARQHVKRPKPHREQFNHPRDLKNYQTNDDDDDDVQLHVEIEKTPDEHREQHESESVKKIPTRPIYPGEGQWAKRGRKHRPFVREPTPETADKGEEEKDAENNEETPDQNDRENDQNNDENEHPDGYEVFKKGQLTFEKQRNQYDKNFEDHIETHFPNSHINKNKPRKIPRNHKPIYESIEDKSEDKDDDKDAEFVPTKLYSQVRRSENVEHLPIQYEDPRLREVIKDSTIHTVYTEEGYEDSGYDHDGHEKNAEHSEGFSEFDKEIESDKEKKLPKRTHDLESAGSNSKINKLKNKNNFMKTKQNKTMTVNQDNNGNKNMEISSETKTILTPNNETKSYKYVNISPKIYRYDKLKRRKRSTLDFPKIEIDTDFIGKINHTLPPLLKQENSKYPYYRASELNPNSPLRYAENLGNIPKKTEDDFAFYKQADRISCPEVPSDINPIPDRIENAEEQNGEKDHEHPNLPRLKHLGDKIDCLKVKYFGENPLDSPFFKEETILPVGNIFEEINTKLQNPNYVNEIINEGEKDHLELLQQNEQLSQNDYIEEDSQETQNKLIKGSFDAFNNNETDNIEEKQPETIVKEDYLEEEEVGNETQINTEHNDDVKKNQQSIQDDKLGISILTDIISQLKTTNGTESSPNVNTDKFDNSTDAKNETIYAPKQHKYNEIDLSTGSSSNSSERIDLESSEESGQAKQSTREPKILNFSNETDTSAAELTPSSEALILRRKIQRKHRPRRPQIQIFDVSRYLPKNPYSHMDRIILTNTATPKYKTISEVHYKDDIKPNEQLNVLADVINNIKTSANISINDGLQSSAEIATRLRNIASKRSPARFGHFKDYGTINIADNRYLTTTARIPQIVSSLNHKNHNYNSDKYDEQYDDDLLSVTEFNFDSMKINNNNNKPTVVHTKSTTTTTTETPSEENLQNFDYSEEDVNVSDLVPPNQNSYQTIHNPEVTKSTQLYTEVIIPQDKVANNYYVIGLRPPPINQLPQIYSDYKFSKVNQRRSNIHRGKRSAARQNYSELIRNRNKPIDVEDTTEAIVVDEDDDYVPHRPKNYHYDEKLGRIVYDNPKKDVEEEEEYLEITEVPLPKPTPRTKANSFPFSLNYNESGPSYLDFIKKLKSAPNYQEIPDPTTTEKGSEATTTNTTVMPESTTPPEFLSILAKVKSNSNYKVIEDEDKKNKTTTTTEAPVESGEDEEETGETQVGNVQNSPGGQNLAQNFEIFDINEYLPKIKNYSPRTTIDYSKYKTIERPNVTLRHNFSSRYNEDEESLEDVKTGKLPILINEDIGDDAVSARMEPSSTELPITTTITPITTPVVATTPKIRGRSKLRRTTTTTTTEKSAIRATTGPGVTHDKAKRVYPRRRPTRIKLSRTTEPALEEEPTKILRRRHQTDTVVPNENFAEEKHPIVVVFVEHPEKRDEKLIAQPTSNSNSTNNTMILPINSTASIPSDKNIARNVEIFDKYDETKKNGGNYKREDEDELDATLADDRMDDDVGDSNEENVEGDETNINEKQHDDGTQLSDVDVPKPFTFYTDPKLPKNVNQLKEVDTEFEEDKENNEELFDEVTSSYYDNDNAKTTTTKKPIFIKDPGKRLYYYAPV